MTLDAPRVIYATVSGLKIGGAHAAVFSGDEYICSPPKPLHFGNWREDDNRNPNAVRYVREDLADRSSEEKTVAEQETTAPNISFQGRVEPWMQQCFGAEISADRLERGDRLIEEVLELLQAVGYPADRVIELISYVWSRPIGEPHQEVGGVMVTLAAFCLAHGIDMHEAGETELARVWTKVEAIRAKQAAKPTGSALPQANKADETLQVNYRNYRGEFSARNITPNFVWFGSTDWHPEPQWLLRAFDHDKQAQRDFALVDFMGPVDHRPYSTDKGGDA